MSKRELAATVLSSPLVQPLGRLAPGSGLRILAYHRVLDDDPATFLFDEEVISATRDEFRRQLDFARRHFDVLSFADLRNFEKEGRPWPRRAAIITFDDGYADNYTHAFPLLKEAGLPAIIFLVTSRQESPGLFWWDLIAYCVKTSPLAQVTLTEISDQAMPLNGDTNDASRRECINRILAWVKSVPEVTKISFLEQLPSRLQVSAPADDARATQLSWAQVREMADGKIEFGGHTVTHPLLTNIEPAQLESEIVGSKRAIEAHLGREAFVFSYPNGCFNEHVVKTVSSSYQFATAYNEGLADRESGCHTLPRIAVEHNYSFALFQANMLFPSIMLQESDRS